MEKIVQIKRSDWLFRPFNYIAGEKSLLLGLVVLIIQALLGALATVHFDGVIDMHIGRPVSVYIYIGEVLISWLSISLVLYIAAVIFSKSKVRVIDVFGTQALARWPMIIAAMFALPAPHEKLEAFMNWRFLGQGQETLLTTGDWVLFFLFLLVDIVMIIWMIALMFNAFKISANLKGPRLVVSFIVGLIIAEVISKVGISWLLI